MPLSNQSDLPDHLNTLPQTVRRLGRLEIRARQIVEGFLSGMHRSPYFGQSLEFREHRQYARGDDLRHVDWKVWARQDRLYVKQYEEDTNLRGMLLVDNSASMAYGGGALTKHEYAATAACVLAYLLLRQNDAVGCITFDEGLRTETPQRSSRSHLSAIAEAVRAEPIEPKTDLGKTLEQVATKIARRGVVVLISDLFGDLEATRRGLAQLRKRGHDVIVLHVMDDDEIDFPFNEATQFVGLESTDEINCNPRALRAGYLKAVEGFLAKARETCLRQQADYQLIRTSEPLDAVLTAVLSPRMQRTRK